MQQDLTLLNFSYQLMNQVFFGFNTIAVQEGAMEKRVEERSELLALRRQAEIELSKAKDPYQAERELLDEEKNDS